VVVWWRGGGVAVCGGVWWCVVVHGVVTQAANSQFGSKIANQRAANSQQPTAKHVNTKSQTNS